MKLQNPNLEEVVIAVVVIEEMVVLLEENSNGIEIEGQEEVIVLQEEKVAEVLAEIAEMELVDLKGHVLKVVDLKLFLVEKVVLEVRVQAEEKVELQELTDVAEEMVEVLAEEVVLLEEADQDLLVNHSIKNLN